MLWTGSRGWQDADTVIDAVTSLRRPFRSIVGDAKGFDEIVWTVLSTFYLPRWRFNACWNELGLRAGPIRNALMLNCLGRLDSSGFVIAGWDGESRGTKDCMDKAAKRGVTVWRLTYAPQLNRRSA